MDGYYIVSNATRGTCYIKQNRDDALIIKSKLEGMYPQVTFYMGCCDSTGYVWWDKPTFPSSKKEGETNGY